MLLDMNPLTAVIKTGRALGGRVDISECAETVRSAAGPESDQDVVDSRGFILVCLRPFFVPFNNAWFAGRRHDGNSRRILVD